MTSRRGVLKLIGGGVVLAAAGAGGFVALNQPSRAARKAWRVAGQETEFRRRFLSYALLAPNPHNRQPWLVQMEGNDALTLYVDLERRLPATDPFDRQIVIGCGAFLELLVLAGAQEGFGAEVQMFPEGEDMAKLDARPIAHVRFSALSAKPDPLFAHVLARRSNKEAYLPENVPEDALGRLIEEGARFGQVSGGTGNTSLADQLRDLTWQAHKLEVETPRTNQESVDLMRIGSAEVKANPDGIELEGPMIGLGKAIGLISREALADQSSEGFRQGLAMYEAMAMSARGFVWIANDNQSRADQIDAGRAYVRMNLRATELGLGLHPWSQALQEYDEMAPLYARVHGLIGGGKRLQMLARTGFGPDVGPTPRRGLEAHLLR
jgi:hypothetical protein